MIFCRRPSSSITLAALGHIGQHLASAPLGFESVEKMIHEGYGLEPAEIAVAVEWLRLNPPKEPLPLDTAIKLGKQEIGLGKPGPGRGHKTGDNVTRLKRGNSRAYILKRLKRDRPDLADARTSSTPALTTIRSTL